MLPPLSLANAARNLLRWKKMQNSQLPPVQPWHAIVWTWVYHLAQMTSSEGRDPIFQNTQLREPRESSINNSSKKRCTGTCFHYLFFSPLQIFGSMCLSLVWFPRGSSLPGAPMKMEKTALDWACPSPSRASRNTWLSQTGFWVHSACMLGLAGNWVLQSPIGRRNQEKCFGLVHGHSCQMAKLGLPCCGPRGCLLINPTEQTVPKPWSKVKKSGVGRCRISSCFTEKK